MCTPRHIPRLAVFLLYTLVTGPAFAATPDVVEYVATLRQGEAPAEGTFALAVALYDGESAGNARFTHTDPSVLVVDGLLILELGVDPTAPLDQDLFEQGPLFLSISVDGTELTPRLPLTSALYARRATSAADTDTVGGLGPDEITALIPVAGTGLQSTSTTFSLATSGVTSVIIEDGAVTAGDLAVNSVISTKIANDAVTAAALAADAVGSAELAVAAVGTAELADGSIESADFKAASVSANALAPSSVTDTKIANGSIAAADLPANAVPLFTVSAAAAANCSSQNPGTLTVAPSCTQGECAGNPPAGCACEIVSGGLNFVICPNTPIGRLVP